ncbi:ScbA/BarX family gamma-butyrolactone biosynthesis protein [Streptomyces olivoreticuli]|uniref:ScbA/BarX family gamma-butyrolactone biosynthesis protein n=1 Tax=Streptomyces olivoreticuli TaxID=68246 RepID=UPI00265AE05C|nr:ScbA/BarX family gamma-butyrolactone biosynthesis protein [Streptomyces olivoreticuli]WKK25787.1 ScbA/BarX family gamma-butyrolactone biosynthesis protein [Streptomyces olivoreticuli]
MFASVQSPAAGPAAGSVPQTYVHKSDPAEVRLTSWCRTGPHAFRIGTRRPAGDELRHGRGGSTDPLLFVETVRQTFPLLCHVAYGVPLGHQLIWQRFSYRIQNHAYDTQLPDGEVALYVECFDIVLRRERLTALSMRFRMMRGDVLLATAETRFAVQTPGVYRRLRGTHADATDAMLRALPAPAPLSHELVGRRDAEDVALSPAGSPPAGAHRWQLRVVTTHPVFFDHPVDHAPGILLIEAAHQAACVTAGGLPADITALDCEFTRYVELDAPCLLTATALETAADGTLRTRVVAEQGGEVQFAATVAHHSAPVLAAACVSAH